MSGGAGVTTPHDVLLLVPLVIFVIFVAYHVFGITGFGASPITIPVLVHLLPLAFVLQADTRELVTLVPFTLLGLTLGVTLLLRLPRDATLLALGLFVCAYAVNLMLRRETRRRLSRWWAAPAGIVGGLVGALFGMGGAAVRHVPRGLDRRSGCATGHHLADGDPQRRIAGTRVRPGGTVIART